MQYLDDPDQLPALPDPGPRDGRHGVDVDDEYDPFPAAHSVAFEAIDALVVPLDDAKRHVSVLLARAESGQEIIVTQHGIPVARMVPPQRSVSRTHQPSSTPVDALAWRNTLQQPPVSSGKAASEPPTEMRVSPSPTPAVPTISSVTRVVSLATVDGATIVGEIVVDANGTLRALVLDDLDQLPALPDPGPRDGRHGVDRETDIPQPLLRPPGRTSRRTTRSG
jgi:prevent-host-death family protein